MLLPFISRMQRVHSLKPRLCMTLFAWCTVRCLHLSRGAMVRVPVPMLQAADSNPPVGAVPTAALLCSHLDRGQFAQQLPGNGNAAATGTTIPYNASLKLEPCMMLHACCTHALLAPGSGLWSFRSR